MHGVVGLGPEGDTAVETPAFDRQGEGALHLFTGANAARADDAFRRVVGEVGVAAILGDIAGVGGTIVSAGAKVARRISQSVFDKLVLGLTVLAAIGLLIP